MPEDIEKREHEKLVRILKDYLVEKGYTVKTESTSEYAGYKADVEAKKGKEFLCIEVINGKNIDAPEIKKKWQAISGNRDWDFCLFVHKDKVDKVKKLLESWAIYYRKVWTYNPE